METSGTRDRSPETHDWRATAAALVLLLAMLGFGARADHSKHKAWNVVSGWVSHLTK
jgi:hypothetical protein